MKDSTTKNFKKKIREYLYYLEVGKDKRKTDELDYMEIFNFCFLKAPIGESIWYSDSGQNYCKTMIPKNRKIRHINSKIAFLPGDAFQTIKQRMRFENK